MSAPLNLARRPFRNERLPTILLALGCLVLALASVRHALLARDLLPGRARDVMSQVAAREGELSVLRSEAASLGGLSASAETIREWAAVKELVDRRAFSWTGLFAALEKALPPGSGWSRSRRGTARAGWSWRSRRWGARAQTPWPSWSPSSRRETSTAPS